MSGLSLPVGAHLDQSVSTVFNQLQEQAKRAGKAVAEEAKAAARAEEQAWKQAERERARLEKEKIKGAQAAAKAQERAEKDAARETTEIAKEKVRAMMKIDAEMTRFHAQQARERAAADREAAREAERAADGAAKAWVKKREKQKRDMQSTIGAVGHLGMNAAIGAGRFGMNVLGDIASGAGVRLDMASHFQRASELQESATQLSNSGYMPGSAGANGQRVDPNDLMKQAYSVGNETGTGANEIMGAMGTFVGKTGDLEASRDTIKDLAVLSKATGANLTDMADAAADVSNQLGDIPDKGARIRDVMLTIAGQGKLGAVEIKDLASQMAKVASSAQQIEGNPGDNIKLLGAFAQEARQRGGAASATQAATSVQAMINTLKTPARVAAFKEKGIDVYNKAGMIRNPEEIVIQSLQKSGMDPVGFKKMWANVQGARSVEGFASIYRSSYAHTSGSEQEKLAAATRAVRDEFKRLEEVSISEQELRESYAAAMETGKSQAEQFNNQLQEIAQDAQSQLLPALVALAPAVVQLTKSAADAAVSLFGLKKPPAEVLDKANADANRANRSVAGMLQHADSMTEDDYDTAKKLLIRQKQKLASSKTSEKANIADAKAKGTEGGLSDWVTETVGQASQGNWGDALKTLVAPTDSKNWQSVKARTGNVEQGQASLKETEAQERALDEQLKALEDTHDLLKHGVLQVKIVADDTAHRKGNPSPLPGRGLEPTE